MAINIELTVAELYEIRRQDGQFARHEQLSYEGWSDQQIDLLDADDDDWSDEVAVQLADEWDDEELVAEEEGWDWEDMGYGWSRGPKPKRNRSAW